MFVKVGDHEYDTVLSMKKMEDHVLVTTSIYEVRIWPAKKAEIPDPVIRWQTIDNPLVYMFNCIDKIVRDGDILRPESFREFDMVKKLTVKHKGRK